MRSLMLLFVLAGGCGPAASPTPGTSGVDAPASAPTVDPGRLADPVVVPPTAAPAQDPAALYKECEARLEQPEAEGECSADSDCARTGCSSERCITKADAEGFSGTCEMLPCFEVVDTCGCDAGRCRWTLK